MNGRSILKYIEIETLTRERIQPSDAYDVNRGSSTKRLQDYAAA